MGMAERVHGDAGSAVDIVAALRIEQAHALASHQLDLRLCVGGEYVRFLCHFLVLLHGGSSVPFAGKGTGFKHFKRQKPP